MTFWRWVVSLLQQIDTPLDLRKLPEEKLTAVCQEIREQILEVMSNNGGHLASSLGVVELTVALHYVFQSPLDPIIWDVGNQAYAHKLITGRRERFATIRRYGGLSGFTHRTESEHDPFGAGHASTSISAALGIAEGKRLKGEKGKVVAVIGDGGMTGGLAFEALNHAGSLKRDLVVVLNDNGMFISPRVGAMSAWLSRHLTGAGFNRLRKRVKELLVSWPRYGEDAVHFIKRFLESSKVFLTPGILFEGLSFQYVGPVDGHDIKALLDIFRNVQTMEGPVVVHVRTCKGKGFACAERDPSHFHGVSPFCIENGEPKKSPTKTLPTYTDVFSETMVALGEQDQRLVAITAAMPDGTGLSAFAERFPERFYDVGIAEGHAVTFAAGLAVEGFRPVVAIYSTFLQRAFDMVVHDVCLQKLPVTFVLDRAGIVGEDGPTHHGLYDLGYLGMLPNMTIMAPSDENELINMLHTSLDINGPVAVRFPRGSALGIERSEKPERLEIGKGRLVRVVESKPQLAVLCIGHVLDTALKAADLLAGQGIEVMVADARFAKPIDKQMLELIARKCGKILTVEENMLAGGFGQMVRTCLESMGIQVRMTHLGVGDMFVPHGDQKTLRKAVGLDVGGITKAALELVGKSDVSARIA